MVTFRRRNHIHGSDPPNPPDQPGQPESPANPTWRAIVGQAIKDAEQTRRLATLAVVASVCAAVLGVVVVVAGVAAAKGIHLHWPGSHPHSPSPDWLRYAIPVLSAAGASVVTGTIIAIRKAFGSNAPSAEPPTSTHSLPPNHEPAPKLRLWHRLPRTTRQA